MLRLLVILKARSSLLFPRRDIKTVIRLMLMTLEWKRLIGRYGFGIETISQYALKIVSDWVSKLLQSKHIFTIVITKNHLPVLFPC